MCCGNYIGDRPKQNTKRDSSFTVSHADMKQHFKSLGWVYNGMCGCQDNKEVYTHSDYPDWQIWISVGGETVQFRKSYGNSRDTTRKGQAGIRNYGEAYDYWVINNRD